MIQFRKYGTQCTINLPLIKAGSQNFAVSGDYTHASGDVKISKDGGAAATATNNPTALTMGNGAVWQLTLTATEMQAAEVVVTFIDAATKAIEDQCIVIHTFGHASAMIVADLSDGTRLGLTALPNAAAGAANGLPLSVDSSGRVDVLKINGTSQTAKDLGAIDVTNLNTLSGHDPGEAIMGATDLDSTLATIALETSVQTAITDIGALNDISVADILAGVCDTGVTVAKVGEMLAALAAGKVSASSVGGVTTLTYKKRDGSTTSFTVVVTEADKTRATTGALS